ncbi:MAG: RDD family protein [Candidatus Methylumidiphilus sp.]
MESNDIELEYVGFWARVGASIIDTLLISLIILPIVTAVYGTDYWLDDTFIKGPVDFLVTWVFPTVAVVLFWIAKQATPGKMAISARIADAETGKKPSAGQLTIRYLGYYVSMIPLFLGIFWVAFDRRKQGWHDKLAGTVVVRPKCRGPHAVVFKK